MVELPPRLVIPGTGSLAFGVEVPVNYAKPLPAECDAIELPACRYLEFHGAPYANEDDFPIAYEIVYEAVDNYQPEQFGWQYARNTEPTYIYDANGTTGAREAVPVTKANSSVPSS